MPGGPAVPRARESARAEASAFRRRWRWRDRAVVAMAGWAAATLLRLLAWHDGIVRHRDATGLSVVAVGAADAACGAVAPA